MPTAIIKTTVPYRFLDVWVVPCGILSYLLVDNGTQFGSKYLSTLCLHLGTKHIAATAYHPQNNERVERFNKKTVTRQQH